MWTQKYAPGSLEEFAGNKTAVQAMLNWANTWEKQTRKSMLLLGPPGTGKTTLVYLLSKKLNYNLVETNAGDFRTAKALKEGFGSALQQRSLFYKGKIILFDEIDGISGRSDRGAAKEIIRIIESSRYPVFITANDSNKSSVKALKKVSKVVKFEKVEKDEIEKILKSICNRESIKYEDKAIKFMARVADGDIKSAINDLQSVAIGKGSLSYENIHANFRDSEKPLQDTLNIIFKTLNAKNAAEAMNNTEKPPAEILQWVRENIPREYLKARDLSEAYDALSRADVFWGRIRKRQYWRFLAYVSQLISVGVALSKQEKYCNKIITYSYPSTIALFARTKFQRAKEKGITEKLGKELHCSRKVARQYLPLLRLIERNEPVKWEMMKKELEFN